MKGFMDEKPSEDSKEKDPREAVRTIGENIIRKSKTHRKFLADASNLVTNAEDLGGILVLLADSGSDYVNWENIISSGLFYDNSLGSLDETAESFYKAQPLVTSASTTAAAVSTSAFSVDYYQFMDEEQIEKAESAKRKINLFLEREDYQNQVRGLFARFGFEGTEIIAKFSGAWENFKQRPEGLDLTIGSAIPLRETFLLVIEKLIQKRPRQEKAKAYKIISIGNQLGLDGIERDRFNDLQLNIDGFLNKLSGEKQKIEDIRVIEEFMVEGTLLLASFLEALDPDKMRK